MDGMNKCKVQGLLFDYGGTLDTNGRHWANVLWESYRRMAVPVTEEQFRSAYVYGERALAKSPIIGMDDNFHVLLLKKARIELAFLREQGFWKADAADASSAAERIAAYCYEYVCRQLQLSRHVLEQLSPHYPMVMVTNFYGDMKSVLADFHLDTFFSSVVESALVGVRKPDPAIYRKGTEALGLLPGETCVIGDSFDKDIVPAHALGCHTIWLKGEEWKPEEHDTSLADAVITGIEQLPGVLLGNLRRRK